MFPANVVVFAMRVIESIDESICSWLAATSSAENAPLLAASTSSALMSFKSAATSLSAPSVVAMTLIARDELSIA